MDIEIIGEYTYKYDSNKFNRKIKFVRDIKTQIVNAIFHWKRKNGEWEIYDTISQDKIIIQEISDGIRKEIINNRMFEIYNGLKISSLFPETNLKTFDIDKQNLIIQNICDSQINSNIDINNKWKLIIGCTTGYNGYHEKPINLCIYIRII